jgi:hypothetical protein
LTDLLRADQIRLLDPLDTHRVILILVKIDRAPTRLWTIKT